MEEATANKNREGWVWVVVCDKDDGGHYLGLYDEEKDIHFIPAFSSKEEASDCYLNLPRGKGKKYEVQAVHIEELNQDAEKGGFVVALLDSDGKVLK